MTKKPKASTDLAKQLRRAVRDSGLTMYRVATDAGVDRGVMSRFMTAERGLTLAVASRICEVLGLELRPVRKRKG